MLKITWVAAGSLQSLSFDAFSFYLSRPKHFGSLDKKCHKTSKTTSPISFDIVYIIYSAEIRCEN